MSFYSLGAGSGSAMTTRYTRSALGGRRSAFKIFSKAGGESTPGRVSHWVTLVRAELMVAVSVSCFSLKPWLKSSRSFFCWLT
jgi:hypothetical protein